MLAVPIQGGNAVMRRHLTRVAIAAVLAAAPALARDGFGKEWEAENHDRHGRDQSVQLGPRPFYPVEKRSPSRQQVGILGIFSDWQATVTYYVNCMGLK